MEATNLLASFTSVKRFTVLDPGMLLKSLLYVPSAFVSRTRCWPLFLLFIVFELNLYKMTFYFRIAEFTLVSFMFHYR
jgi:hypothetical protein